MLLHNLPTRWMVSGSTRAMSCAMDPPPTEGARANVSLGESNGRTVCADHGSGGVRDLVSAYMVPLVFFLGA